MAFCPNCGQSVGEQAAKCTACGKDLGKQPKGARFKGTMLMTPTAVPAGMQLPAPTPQQAGAVPPRPLAQAPAPAGAPQPAGEAPKKRNMKATMLGTGNAMGAGAFSSAPPPAAAGPAPVAAPAAAPQSSSTAPVAAAPHARAAAPHARMDALADTAPQPQSRGREDDSKRFLVGDPMAPQTPPEGSARRHLDYQPAGVSSGNRMLVMLTVAGLIAIAAVGYFTARKLGLL